MGMEWRCGYASVHRNEIKQVKSNVSKASKEQRAKRKNNKYTQRKKNAKT